MTKLHTQTTDQMKQESLLSDALPSLFHQIETRSKNRFPYIIAIDGMCGSGKTTLAKTFQEQFGCSVIHMDDFFLPPELRTAKRLSEPGGNVHYERFLEEVFSPLSLLKRSQQQKNTTLAFSPVNASDPNCAGHSKNRPNTDAGTVLSYNAYMAKNDNTSAPQYGSLSPLSYRRFDCSRMDYAPNATVVPLTPVIVIEGSYSLRREFRSLYDLTIFLYCDKEVQKERLLKRVGTERFQSFETRWIPMEEAYFSALSVREAAELLLDTASL